MCCVSLQRVYETMFCGKPAIVKERFSKKYRHPTLDASLTKKRLAAVCYCFHRFEFRVCELVWAVCAYRKLDVWYDVGRLVFVHRARCLLMRRTLGFTWRLCLASPRAHS